MRQNFGITKLETIRKTEATQLTRQISQEADEQAPPQVGLEMGPKQEENGGRVL